MFDELVLPEELQARVFDRLVDPGVQTVMLSFSASFLFRIYL